MDIIFEVLEIDRNPQPKCFKNRLTQIIKPAKIVYSFKILLELLFSKDGIKNEYDEKRFGHIRHHCEEEDVLTSHLISFL